MKYLHQDKVNIDFILKVEGISKALEVPVNHLMALMDYETAGTFSPSITNALGYVGLIQFGKAAAQDLNTTQVALKQMTAVEQLDYVYLYLKRYKSKINSYVDLYLAVFFPLALGKGRDFVLQSRRLKASRIAKANKGFDLNKDGKITVGEVEDKLIQRVPHPYKEELKKKTCPHCGQSF